ncbi:MAG TPA: lipoprotein [Steroidobacteraceae bacterium]|nr:lipoprotein [Steroidobacteraceae bacterium]
MKQSGWILVVCASVALGGCGMKGPLFLPDKNASVVTRPGTSGTTTPPAQTAPAQAPGDSTPATPSTPSTPKPPQDKDKDDSQSTSSTPKS